MIDFLLSQITAILLKLELFIILLKSRNLTAILLKARTLHYSCSSLESFTSCSARNSLSYWLEISLPRTLHYLAQVRTLHYLAQARTLHYHAQARTLHYIAQARTLVS
ncbi:hypothetical protein AVEN_191619-1 [Araneus ventricosus]|uniref:Uncharacterized protein n=1 Tax=Araneus ventricosus TaxID=182803 RepID=A0A4Y2XBS3_ARAVE|nr:hypothetical protein AVEN_191619-1 [Araneus ventricosus]